LTQPTLQEYQEAIQRPDLCFKDPDLKKGETTPGVFGLPKVISGGFAGVFQVKTGKTSYAARCFLREGDDTEKRYKAIHDFLHRKQINCIVKFDYINQGILVKGEWYPILKMEWLEGETLSTYIENNHHNQETMTVMASKFKTIVEELHKRGISHGDLHDQNIMVVKGELKVIDYDAMYVPRLKGQDCSEVGHINYQHPERRLSHYGPYLDHFSEWGIYISLKALANDPGIWDEVNGGDQCLIFRNTDYQDPENSRAFKALSRIENDNLAMLVETFRDAVYTYNLEDIPSILDENNITRRRKLEREVAEIPEINMEGLEVKYASGDNSWIWDNKKVDYKHFMGTRGYERVAVTLPLFYLLLVEASFILGWLPSGNLVLITLGAPALALLLPVSYWTNTQVKERRSKSRELRKLENETRALRNKIQQELKTITQFKSRENEDVKKLRDQIVSLKNQESRELKKIESSHWNRLREIEEAMKGLVDREKNERERQLKVKKERYIVEKLKSHRLAGNRVSNLGLVKRFLLSMQGIRSAADFTDISHNRTIFMDNGARFRLRNGSTTIVGGLNSQQIRSLRDWQRSLIKRYEGKSPDKLSPEESKKISERYKTHRASLKEEEKKVKETIQEEKKVTRDGFSKKTANLKNEIEGKKQRHDEEVNKTQSILDKICEEISGLDWEINKIRHQLRGYSEISFKNYLKQILTT
jgi:serine/threonine protein kinase